MKQQKKLKKIQRVYINPTVVSPEIFILQDNTIYEIKHK